MSLTAKDAALDCLSYAGVFNLLPTGAQKEAFVVERPAMLRRIARDMTTVGQRIYRARPDLFRRRVSMTAAAVETKTVGVTTGSTAVTITTAFSHNLDGATINVGGVWGTARQNGATVTLLAPWGGATGTVAMVAYGDCLVLDPATIVGVEGEVYRDNVIPLANLPNRRAYATYDEGPGSDYGRRGVHTRQAVIHRPGPVAAYWMEAEQQTGGPALRMHLTPLPDRATPIEFDAQLRAPSFTSDDFGTNETDPGKSLNLRPDCDESIFLPLLLEAWSGSAWFRDAEARAAIADQARQARQDLDNVQVQSQAGASITVSGI